ncbi:transposase [Salinimicrobium soli]|uniref:transposase n=1 Tax=Salinimicrobium soli TaxID=1254399 RepID=UPI003AB01C33
MEVLEPDKYYHIYNRANGNEKIFLNKGNYSFFLHKYQQHIQPIANTLCYCLMPNHFHFLIKIRPSEEIEQTGHEDPSKMGLYCSKKFSNFFSSYAQAYNKQHNRTGSLFQKNFKRKIVDSEKYLFQLIHYIHLNPVRANLVEKPEDWEFSSYQKLTSTGPTFLQKKEILGLYDGIENFEYVHSKIISYDDLI